MTGIIVKFRDDTPDLKLVPVHTIRFKDGKVIFTVPDERKLGNHRLQYATERIAWINLWTS